MTRFDTILISTFTIPLFAFVALLLVRRVYRALPVFFAYNVYSLCIQVISIVAARHGVESYLQLWVVSYSIDAIFYLCVLAEVARNLLRHNQPATHELLTATFLFVPFCLAAWSLASWTIDPTYSLLWRLAFLLVQITGTVPPAAFLSLAVWSHVTHLNWPERELRVATGMGSWALVSFVASVLHSHGLNSPEYHWIDLLTPICCLIVYLYWLYSFLMESVPAAKAQHADRNSAAGKQPSPRRPALGRTP